MGVNKSYRGQCLCGSISYEVDQFDPKMAHCHCSMCRKFHGAAFATFGAAKKADFRWLSGESLLKTYQAKNGTNRQFCSECGSSLTFSGAEDDGSIVEIALGTLDTELPIQPDAHIYTKYGADWYQSGDDLPKFEEGRVSKSDS